MLCFWLDTDDAKAAAFDVLAKAAKTVYFDDIAKGYVLGINDFLAEMEKREVEKREAAEKNKD